MVKGVVRADFYEDSRTQPRKHFIVLSANSIAYIQNDCNAPVQNANFAVQ